MASYAFSHDAVSWTLSGATPYNCTLAFTDGTQGEASGCGNRPQIVFDGSNDPAAGPTLAWLINGATGNKPNGGAGSWTLFQELSK